MLQSSTLTLTQRGPHLGLYNDTNTEYQEEISHLVLVFYEIRFLTIAPWHVIYEDY